MVMRDTWYGDLDTYPPLRHSPVSPCDTLPCVTPPEPLEEADCSQSCSLLPPPQEVTCVKLASLGSQFHCKDLGGALGQDRLG